MPIFRPSAFKWQCDKCGVFFGAGKGGVCRQCNRALCDSHLYGSFFEKLKASVEPGLVEMVQIPGLGPKKIQALKAKLGITDIAALTAACRDGRVAELEGFGEKTQEKILAGIKNREAYGKRHLWWDAAEVAQAALRERVVLAPGNVFSLTQSAADLMRFNVAQMNAQALRIIGQSLR